MTARDEIRRYLLGELPEEEAERIEESYFSNDDRFAEVLAAEDDLIEGFLHGRLDATDRKRFEARFLSTERGRIKVALAAALERASAQHLPRRRQWIRDLAVAAALVLLVLSAGLFHEIVSLRRQIEHLERPQPIVAPPVFSIILTSVERGAGSPTTITLPKSAAVAELWLLLPRDDYPTYTAALQSIDGRTLWSAHGLRSRAVDAKNALIARIPSSSLDAGTFIVTVTGEKSDGSTEPVEDFSFTVRRP